MYDEYKQHNFYVDGYQGTLICPKNPRKGKDYIWRTEFLGAFDSADRELLHRGWYLAYYQISNQFGCSEAIRKMRCFQKYLEETFHLSKSAVLFGFSRGGLYAVNYAAAYPGSVRKLYLDAPVLDIFSWPGGFGKGDGSKEDWEMCRKCYQIDKSVQEVTDNPVNKLDILIHNRIPVFLIAGDSDTAVPFEENGKKLYEKYRKAGEEIKLILKKGVGHHPHSLENGTGIANWIEKTIHCSGLLTNGVSQPLCIDPEDPVFSWKTVHCSRGGKQRAFRILVSSSRENSLELKGDIWDSGKVISEDSVSVIYQGKSLRPGVRYWWRVAVWDTENRCSGYSESTFFDTGLGYEDWNAAYIWDGTEKTNHFAEFRKKFLIDREVAFAKIFVFAHNEYQLTVNGKYIGKGPARSDPETYGQYNAYDVTDYLGKGENTFSAMAHWHGEWVDSGINAIPAFILQCEITYQDGTYERIVTDESWEAAEYTPYVESDPVYFGQAGGEKNRCALCYDRRRVMQRRLEEQDKKGWKQAKRVEQTKYRLHAQLVLQDQVQEILTPEKIEQKNGIWYVTFQHCICGYPRLLLRESKEGSRIRIQYFQLPDFTGEAGWDEYICAGNSEMDVFEPAFGHHSSFMTLKIIGYGGVLNETNIYAVVSHTDFDIAGEFQCSDQLLNDVYRMCVRSAVQNVQQGIISVDANREQSPWLADSWNVGMGILYNCRNTMLLDKIVKDYAEEQMECGDFYACSPARIYRIPEWSMYWPMLLWQQYLFYGNRQFLEQYYPTLCRFINWISQYEDGRTHLIDPPDGSWQDGIRFSDYADGSILNGGLNIATNSQFCENLRIAALAAEETGHMEDAAMFGEKYEQVKYAINEYLRNENHVYVTKVGTEETMVLGSCWPLRFDLVPDEARASLREWILSQPDHLFGGYGGDTYYNGMFRLDGMDEVLIQDFSRYRKMLESNRTNWETWDHGEFNHAWTSYPAYIFPKYLLGIEPAAAGFREFIIKPHIAGLRFAKGAVPTIHGTIVVEWEQRENMIALSCTIPCGTEAYLYMKNGINTVLEENGEIIWPHTGNQTEIRGICFSEEEKGYIKVRVKSGIYYFRLYKKL